MNRREAPEPTHSPGQAEIGWARNCGAGTGLRNFDDFRVTVVAGFARIQMDVCLKAEFLRIQLQTCSCALRNCRGGENWTPDGRVLGRVVRGIVFRRKRDGRRVESRRGAG